MNKWIKDWAGEKVERDACPECTSHPDCFAWVDGHCTALKTPDNRIKRKRMKECAFYQPTEEVRTKAMQAYQRLRKAGRFDLITQYMETMIATGAMDGEIRAAEAEGAALRPSGTGV